MRINREWSIVEVTGTHETATKGAEIVKAALDEISRTNR